MDPLDDFLSQIEQCTKLSTTQQAERINQLLNLSPEVNPYLVVLNNANMNIEKLDSIVEKRQFYNDEWLAFNELVISFLKLSSELDPWSMLDSFDLYSQFISDLAIAFNNNNRGQLLSYLVKSSTDIIYPMAVRLDDQLYYKENCVRPRLAYLASILLKVFNNIRSQLGDPTDTSLKKTTILFVGVRLCSVYFKLNNPLLCRNIFSNMNNASLVFSSFSLNEQLQYRYFLARFYLIKNQLVDSYVHFRWCLCHCPPSRDHPNITRILKFFIPVSIIIGKRPNYQFIASTYYTQFPSFLIVYSELSESIRSGHVARFNNILHQNYKLLIRSNLLVLFCKADLIILRNMIRRLWVISGKPSRLDYDSIKAALLVSWGGLQNTGLTFNLFTFQQPEDSTIENIMISLIDQNLIRGKIFPRLRTVALSKTNIFANIDTINFTRFGHGLEGSLSPIDRWMDS